MTHEPEGTLSAAGERRRDAMLGTLVDEMKALHRRRRARRRIAGAATLAVLAIGLTVTFTVLPTAGPPAEPPTVIVEAPAPGDIAPAVAATGITVVRTDPDILDRYRAAPVDRSGIIPLDDDALLVVLASMDRPAGLIRRGDHTWLTTEVTDAGLGEKPSL
jgi:hypothetical protein